MVYFVKERTHFKEYKEFMQQKKIGLFKNIIFDGINKSLKDDLLIFYYFSYRSSVSDSYETLNVLKKTVIYWKKIVWRYVFFFIDAFSCKLCRPRWFFISRNSPLLEALKHWKACALKIFCRQLKVWIFLIDLILWNSYHQVQKLIYIVFFQ